MCETSEAAQKTLGNNMLSAAVNWSQRILNFEFSFPKLQLCLHMKPPCGKR